MADVVEEERAEGMLTAAALVRQVKRNYEEQSATASSGAERSHYDTCAGVASQCIDSIERGLRGGVHRGPTARTELERLAAYLMEHHGGEIVEGSAVDTAIRLLGKK